MSKQKKLRRYAVPVIVTRMEYVFATSPKEAKKTVESEVGPYTGPYAMLSEQKCGTAKATQYADQRHPALIPLEGQRVLVTFKCGDSEKLWVTPLGRGTLCAMNSEIHSALSKTRNWDCRWSLCGFGMQTPFGANHPMIKSVRRLDKKGFPVVE